MRLEWEADPESVFQFHIGSIQSRNYGGEYAPHKCVSIPHWFDSKVCALKRFVWKVKFQFHIGSIQSANLAFMRNATLGFQFHIGSIQSLQQKARAFGATCVSIPHWFDSKQREMERRTSNLPGFNSTLVRFKVSSTYTQNTGGNPFQFHIGSIQSASQRAQAAPWSRFQFHIGSIQRSPALLRASSTTAFQFHIGSIQSMQSDGELVITIVFQFHIGSIQSCLPRAASGKSYWFQFHIGSIQRTPEQQANLRRQCFNSTLVRFKARTAYAQPAYSMTFQFHIGSIQRPSVIKSNFHWISFQFHIGSIQSTRRALHGDDKICFNSTLVRFKDR